MEDDFSSPSHSRAFPFDLSSVVRCSGHQGTRITHLIKSFNCPLWNVTLTGTSRRWKRRLLFCKRTMNEFLLSVCLSDASSLHVCLCEAKLCVNPQPIASIIHTDAVALYTVHINFSLSLSAKPLCGLQPPWPIHVTTTNQCTQIMNSAEYTGAQCTRLIRGFAPDAIQNKLLKCTKTCSEA